ncbi:MAG TPA: carboxypeptidase-like regulatory domain-containing protein [Polyangia bacterium]|nr:carboxypeptidase-like regulatory domain-containing protein [Polyangia bacterium]
MAVILAGGFACRGSRPRRDAAVDVGVAAEGKVGPPVDLAGMVQDSRGTPLPDALVIAWPKDRRHGSVVQARSDREGRFVLSLLRPGTWTLLAEAAGFGTLELDWAVPDPEPLVLALEGEGRSLSGIVLGTPTRSETGAHVVLGGPGVRWPRETVAETHGVFSFAGLGLGRFAVRATHGKLVSATVSQVLEENTGHLAPLRLRLGPGGFVEGRVRDDTGRNLPGVTVDVLTMPSDDLPVTCQADEEGKFTVGPIRPGRYQVLARLEGHILLDAPEVLLAAGSRVSVAPRLARAALVSGRVLDQDGAPLRGVPVSVVGLVGGQDEVIVLPGALPTAAEAAELPPGSVVRQGSIRTALSDVQGRFEVRGLAPGRSRLEVSPADKLSLRREPLLLAPGDVRDLGDLVVLTGVLVSGRVLDQDGLVIEGAQVEARAAGKPARPTIRVTSDQQGQFFVRLPAGEYLLAAGSRNYALQTIPIVRAVGHPEPVEFRLAARAASADAGVPGPSRATPAHRR